MVNRKRHDRYKVTDNKQQIHDRSDIEGHPKRYRYNRLMTHPRTRMFVSNTDTTTSVSNMTSSMTKRTAFSKSATSPSTWHSTALVQRHSSFLLPHPPVLHTP